MGVRGYNTLLERQTNFVPVNMDTTMFINMFDGLTMTGMLTLPQVLIATQVTLRLLHLPLLHLL